MQRRHFLATSLLAGVSLARWPAAARASNAGADPHFRLALDAPARFFDGENFWCHARAGIVPGAGQQGSPRVVLTMNTMETAGNDVYKNMVGMQTDDLGKSWTEPHEIATLAPRYEKVDGAERPVTIADFWPTWHAATGVLLGTGHTATYTPEWKVIQPRPRHTAYAHYDPRSNQWSVWDTVEMPHDATFQDAGAGCTQRYDLDDGTILLPFYFRPGGKSSRVAVMRCRFNGQTLRYVEHGNELSIDDKTRGLHEPSIARFGDTYFLTIRNDKLGFVTTSRDGLQYEPMRPWTFDDGSELGNYNTQQHWVTHSGGLFLVYTRRGANNDHVFRHRAPLFIAQVDPQRLQVIRSTETILVPERGARLGNFGVTDVSPDETWVTVNEWMQPRGVEKHGSDGSVFIARLHWNEPNKLFRATKPSNT